MLPTTTISEPPSTFTSSHNEGGCGDNTEVTHRPSSSRGLHPTSIQSHARRGSGATTESATTSPTTSLSTDDSTLTDPSPSSSPESPNIAHLKDTETPTVKSMDASRTLEIFPPRHDDRAVSPNKRPRNAKGLSINTAGISTISTRHPKSGQQSAASLPAPTVSRLLPSVIPNHIGGNDSTRPFSEPSTPAFIVPSFPARKSKLGLTITTPDSRGNIAVPQTPLRGPMAPLPLRTRTSEMTLQPVPETPIPLSSMRENDDGRPLFSPSMAPQGGMTLPAFGNYRDPSLPTPGFGPEGGMRFPSSNSSESSPYGRVSRPPLTLPKTTFDSPQSSSVVQHTIEHNPSTPLHDLPLSQEAKSPGYPDGPICIYPPGVFLYHQPTREEARKFDVIINVAREVTNPFTEPEEEPEVPVEPKYRDVGIQCMLLVGPGEKIPEPLQSFELIDEDEPATPKANTPKSSDPEYIHLPWEHNSKVYEDWLNICELIDNRVQDGKKVLIHCQLGVSRSASLIVAYGIYKNPRLTPDEAREQAKRQSRFIDLNMHFMYELGDFKKLLAEKLPKEQAPRRPVGHKALTRTMTDSVLSMNSHGRDTMTPILDEGEEETQTMFPASPMAGQPAPLSAPLASISMRSAPVTPQPETVSSDPNENEDQSRAGEKTPRAEDHVTELTLPPIKTMPTNVGSKPMITLPPADIKVPKLSVVGDGLKSPPPLQLALPPRPHIENIAKNTDLLPSPHLELPSPPVSGSRRTLRPMPSLPAGFSSINRGGESKPFGGLKLAIEALKSPTGPSAGDDMLSPRLQEFTATPFHRSVRSLAGDLAEHTGALPTPRDHDKDPRSPPTKGEVVVMRNIDDILG